MNPVGSVPELENAVGKPVSAMMLKTIDHLDEHCRTILAVSTAAVLGYVDRDGVQRTRLLGGAPGFAKVTAPTRLDLGFPDDAAAGGASLLMLVPGWRETLRINGTVGADGFTVREAYLHCGKAVIRAGLWNPAAPVAPAAEDDAAAIGPAAAAFLGAAPFAVISSRDEDGRADSSPRGDPAGDLRLLGPTTVAIADRPGNRRTDTLHNIVAHPEVAVLVLVPGDDRTLELTGTATISTDTDLREQLAERGKAPKAVVVVEVSRVRLARSEEIATAALWDTGRHVDRDALPRPSAVWTDHVKRNTTGGVGARVLRAVANERVMRAGVDLDYRQNLY
ncbi:pyridoxamine 5'-phosphate oxidase family protein [Tsukamurella paurometabola]|uniref:Pyridoxamine 5'-phosphate oxidase family protein n=1 Tax=Tsukamurella paurometabola TaxID=2061 RepID=A0ABS5N9M8_TSUPA|nr:pyridoxamine 5'-phosphate oxidase family protein [Tsukamurella paurometabola]MBS4100193.1 pyridoxamine 5'-phosphate oxidase family protein [Tsukamurella paurometabola]